MTPTLHKKEITRLLNEIQMYKDIIASLSDPDAEAERQAYRTLLSDARIELMKHTTPEETE